MEDTAILQLYQARSQDAITATAEKYGRRCTCIARHILGSGEDAEECVSDAYLALWNAIPPQRPAHLGAYLGKTVRNLALHRYERDRAQKRFGGETALSLTELEECIPAAQRAEDALEEAELSACLNEFLRSLPAEKRRLFIRRYWALTPVGELAQAEGRSVSAVSAALFRLRRECRQFLQTRGIEQ